MKLKGQHALVTGGGTGIGAAIARALAAEGAAITLVGRRQETLEVACVGIGFFQVADVTDRTQVDTAVAGARAVQGPITILVNNAGAAQSASFAKLTVEGWRAMMAVNLDGVFNCCQSALADLLKAKHGRIVTVASTAALKGYPYTAAYGAAKHGALGLTRALAAEFAKTSLTVNAVCPGFTDTDLATEAVAQLREKTGRTENEARAELAQFNPQKRLVTPEEVAAAVLWLSLPESQAMNGQAIAVAGGEIM